MGGFGGGGEISAVVATANIPYTPPPETPKLPPREWVKENLFSSKFNSILTVVSSILLLAIARGLLSFIFNPQRQWNATATNLRLLMTQAYPESQYVRIWVCVAILLILTSVSMAVWRTARVVALPDLGRRLLSRGAILALLTLLKKTRLGLQVRAVSQNRTTARAMGIRSERVNALTFGLGSGIAGIAGVALAQLTNVGPNLGQSYIIDSFMVVVFGGVGNLWGTLTAAFSLGIANKLLEPMAGAVLAKIIVLIFIILFIQRKPRGLFPQRGRAAEE